jgi:hypothetical protein
VAITKRLMWEGVGDTVETSRLKEDELLEWIGKSPDALGGHVVYRKAKASMVDVGGQGCAKGNAKVEALPAGEFGSTFF